MLKIRTKLISAVLMLAVIIATVLSAALPVTADDSDRTLSGLPTSGTLDELAKPYPLGLRLRETPTFDLYTFKLTSKTTLNVHMSAKLPDNESYGLFTFVDSKAHDVKYSDVNIIAGKYDVHGLKRSPGSGEAEVNFKYENLLPGTYYFVKHQCDITVAPEPFVAGSVATDVVASLDNAAGNIRVKWGEVTNARYAVYYVYIDKATGAFSEWGTAASSEAEYVIPAAAKNADYYITILPFSDIPARQYGGFSPYAQVKT